MTGKPCPDASLCQAGDACAGWCKPAKTPYVEMRVCRSPYCECPVNQCSQGLPDCRGDAVSLAYATGSSKSKKQPWIPTEDAPKSGRTPEMLQDDCKKLSLWLANKPDARLHAREAAARIQLERNA